MDIARILSLYDQEQRQTPSDPDYIYESGPTYVRALHADVDRLCFVLYSCLTPATAERAIEEQIAYFEGIGRDFEWTVYAHDTPHDLRERLVGRGFALEETDQKEAILVLDVEKAPPLLLDPVRHDIRRLEDPGQVGEVVSIESQVWGGDFSWLGKRLSNVLRSYPNYLSVYVAYIDGQPVSAAWMHTHGGTHFASLWGGSTLEGYRRRGLYTSLLAVRLQEARRRGVRYLTVDASAMSRPILEKYGFQRISSSYACKWKVKRDKTGDRGAAKNAVKGIGED